MGGFFWFYSPKMKKLFIFFGIGCIIYKDYYAAFAANCEGVKNR